MSGRLQLGDVVDIIAGQHIEANLHHSEPSGTPYLTGPADFGELTPTITKWTNAPKVFASSEDVLVTVKGAGVGKSNLGCDAAIGRQLMAVRPRAGKILQNYLFHYVRFQEKEIARVADGATVPGIGKEDLASLTIPGHSLPEQRRIAAILDAADAMRRKRKRALDLLHELTQSIFLEIFGDPSTNRKGFCRGTVSDLLTETQYGTSAKAGNAGAYPILRMGNITNSGRIDLENIKWIDLNALEREKYTVRRGDIIFNRTNSADLVGKSAVFDQDQAYAFAGYLVRARAKTEALPFYIVGYLNSAHGKATLRKMAKSIVGMANINAREMQSIPILIPDDHSVERYAKAVAAVRKHEQRSQPLLAAAQSLFFSLQHRAFTGQL